jgi:hypothetical protein
VLSNNGTCCRHHDLGHCIRDIRRWRGGAFGALSTINARMAIGVIFQTPPFEPTWKKNSSSPAAKSCLVLISYAEKLQYRYRSFVFTSASNFISPHSQE